LGGAGAQSTQVISSFSRRVPLEAARGISGLTRWWSALQPFMASTTNEVERCWNRASAAALRRARGGA
jgi:hypothetical protein